MSQAPPPFTAQDLDQLTYLYQMLENQQRYLNEQLELLETQLHGIQITKTTLEGLDHLPPDQEIILPLGPNAFIRGRLLDPGKVMVNISNDLIMEKTLVEGMKSITTMQESYLGLQKKLEDQLRDITQKLEDLRPQLEAIYRAGGLPPNA